MSFFDQVVKILGSNGSTAAAVTTRGSKGAVAVEILDASGAQITDFSGTPVQLVTEAYDYVAVTSYNDNGDPLVVQYRSGGASGTLVATLTITYTPAYLISTVTKT